MSEMKHTPGPWAHYHTPTDTLISVNTLDGNEIGGVWCKTWGAGRRGINETVLANAHLIAAAPDLLEALIEARNELEEYERECSGESYNNPKLNAAIARAEGRSE